MATADPNIDEVVNRVLARLRHFESGGPAIDAAPGRHAPASPSESAASPATGELRINEPVVSLSRLAGKLGSVRRVIVRQNAVVTPAARDLLRQKEIVLSRDAGGETSSASAVVLGAAETDFEPAALVRALVQQGIQTQSLPRCGLFSAIDELVDAVTKGGQLGVLLTSETAAALCLANRTRGVRAALGGSLEAVRAARASVGANLLVIDPLGRSLFALIALVRACAAGPSGCPEPMRERLG